MSNGQDKVSVWMVAVGSLLGGLGGVAAVVALVRDFDNPIAQAILDDKSRLAGNRKLTAESYKAGEERESSSWQFAVSQNTSDAYAAYIERFPAGHFVAEAIARQNALLEEHSWQIAVQANTVAAFNLYLVQYPAGSRAGAARANIKRLSEMESVGKLAIGSVDETARPAVLSARKWLASAQEAQREARLGKPGYLSQYRTQSDGLQTAIYGIFEGRIRKKERGLFRLIFVYAELGVWKFDPSKRNPASLTGIFGEDVVEAKGRLISEPSFMEENKYSGELVCSDGRLYQGDFEIDVSSFSPSGYGVLWASDGTLIGSGRWTKGKLDK
jgi:hypothetical protein